MGVSLTRRNAVQIKDGIPNMLLAEHEIRRG
jgi:uncharacterized protein YbaR (Trm112 family)